MSETPANYHAHPDLRSLINDDAFAASFQSMARYRTALLEYGEPAGQGEPEESGLYAAYLIDNWDGEGDTYWLLARKQDDGIWVSEESGKPLIKYEGDRLLKIIPLDSATRPEDQWPSPDAINQIAFEEGQPAEDGDGYLFSAEEFDLFVERLLSSVTPSQPADQQSAPIFGDEDHVSMPRGMIAAACSAIDKKRDAAKVLTELRRYTVGDLSRQAAPDVVGLVEALEYARYWLDRRCSVQGVDTTGPLVKIDTALAAHRKGDE